MKINGEQTHSLFKTRLPIIVASACIGIAGERLDWGFGVSLAIIAAVQVVLLLLKNS